MRLNLGDNLLKPIEYKVSDYVIEFLRAQGITHVFLVSGGASIHFLHSLHSTEGILPIPTHHEQGAAMAADGYSRVGNYLGAAIATSGPGATNLITGIAGTWFDSIPCMFITGQVATFRQRGELEVRQLGFQETNIVDMVKSITKLAIQVKHPNEIQNALIKGFHEANSGRLGPVLIDIPDDIQRSKFYFESPIRISINSPKSRNQKNTEKIREIGRLVKLSKRPVLILGAGANSARTKELSKKLLSNLNIPILTTWGAKDLVSSENENLVGTFGSHGTRFGNFTIQNADLVIALGARLSTRETGGNLNTWARQADLIYIDIDRAEVEKLSVHGKTPKLSITCDLIEFLPELTAFAMQELSEVRFDEWQAWINVRKNRFAYKYSTDKSKISGYDFYLSLNNFLTSKDQLFLDTGCTVAWAMQSLNLPLGAKIFHDNNNTAMGWSIPASIGGALSNPDWRTSSISGDGSFMMNVQELATASRYAPNLKIILLNNSGYAMVRQTEEQWLNGVHVGTDSRKGDLMFPDFQILSNSFGFRSRKVSNMDDLRQALSSMYNDGILNFLEVIIDPEARVVPQTRYGYPLEDSEPILTREELRDNMIVPIIKE